MKTPLVYYGGKQKLIPEVCALITSQKWKTYTECFVGGGAVFFALQEAFPNRRYVINDWNSNITNFYEVAKTPELHSKLMELTERRGIYAQSHFARAGEIIRGAEADRVERAWAVFFQLTCGFAGMMDASTVRTVGISKGGESGDQCTRRLQNKIKRLNCTTAALRNAYILNHDAVDVARRFDTPDAIHFFDPPYIATRMGHYVGYTEDDFANLLAFCAKCEGRFILSHYDNNEALTAAIAENGWRVQKLERMVCFHRSNGDKTPDEQRARTELLVYNFEPTGRAITPPEYRKAEALAI